MVWFMLGSCSAERGTSSQVKTPLSLAFISGSKCRTTWTSISHSEHLDDAACSSEAVAERFCSVPRIVSRKVPQSLQSLSAELDSIITEFPEAADI